jgi:hypothetical protein
VSARLEEIGYRTTLYFMLLTPSYRADSLGVNPQARRLRLPQASYILTHPFFPWTLELALDECYQVLDLLDHNWTAPTDESDFTLVILASEILHFKTKPLRGVCLSCPKSNVVGLGCLSRKP